MVVRKNQPSDSGKPKLEATASAPAAPAKGSTIECFAFGCEGGKFIAGMDKTKTYPCHYCKATGQLDTAWVAKHPYIVSVRNAAHAGFAAWAAWATAAGHPFKVTAAPVAGTKPTANRKRK